ncbi:polysaccharide deacetylase family protein [Micromonospora sp. NPDC000207]|uniref:polysaccharide deacetylase family protein n=1 Tax=Micromonospora sp. NPDC000207 TaxID=3154246 RepID=UPI00331F03A0
MRAATAGRTAALVTLVVVALLGSAYALGRSLVADPAAIQSPGLGAEMTGTQYAEQPPVTGTANPTPDGPDEAPQSGGPSPVPSSSSDDGLYGSQLTTGTDEVALTFDDGPDPNYTPQVLQVLREYGLKATFCVVGENARNHPDLVRAIAADGHTLCNHSWNHDLLLGKRSPDVIRADLIRTSQAIRAAVPDAPIVWFRQPGGAWTYPVVSVARELGMTPLHWTVDPSDWRAPGPQRIANVLTTYVQPGSVVLLHDAGGDRQGTVDALRYALPDLTSRFRLTALPDGAT